MSRTEAGVMLDRGLDTEMDHPKYAQFELERRWLVDAALRPPLEGLQSTLIEDRYVDGTRLRLRRMHRGARTVHKLTKKYENERPEARPIVTIYLTAAEHAVLAALPARALVKRRQDLQVGAHCWSLDVFEGPLAGLEMVEIEAVDEAALAALVPPPWTTKEVTHDPRWQCGTLALTNAIPE